MTAPTLTSSSARRAVRRNRNFMLYVCAANVSNAGSFMQGLTVPFVLHEITGRNSWVGASIFATFVPSFLLTPIAGAAADRYSRRLVLVIANVTQLVVALILWYLSVTGGITPWRTIGLLVIAGVGTGFQFTTSQALPSSLVDAEHLMAAIRTMNVGFTLSRAIGPAAAGLVLDRFGPSTAFGLNAASFLVVLAALTVIKTRETAPTARAEPWAQQLREGFGYMFARPAMRAAMAATLVIAFCSQTVQYLAAGIVSEIYHRRGGGLGAVQTAFGLGSCILSIILLLRGHRFKRSALIMCGLVLYPVGAIIALSTAAFPLALVGFFTMGVGHVMHGVTTNMSLQAQVHDEFRGRVLSGFMSCLLIGLPAGTFAAGVLSDAFGLRPVLVTFSCLTLLFAVYATARLDRLRGLDVNGPTDVGVTAAGPNDPGSNNIG